MPSQGIVYKKIPRPDPNLVAQLSTVSVATAHEVIGRTGLLDASIRPLSTGLKIAGPAVTCMCHAGDNLTVHRALLACARGDVLVITVDEHARSGVWGELLSVAGQAIGLAGLVTDGGVRDTAEIRALGFPVWTRYITAGGTVKQTLGGINMPLVCGGVIVNPGDIVLADDDGVVVIPRLDLAAVVRKSQERTRREDTIRDRLRAGESSVSVLGLDRVLEAVGPVEIDGTYEQAVAGGQRS